MNNFNKSLLAVFMISLFSMVSIQSINKLVGSSDSQVLGIQAPTTTSCKNNTRRCLSTFVQVCINGNWQNFLNCFPGTCSNGNCTGDPVPTSSVPTPKPTIILPTPTSRPQTYNGIPCPTFAYVQQMYCGSSNPTATPTAFQYPTATPTAYQYPTATPICKSGVNGISYLDPCVISGASGAISASYTCYDGYHGVVGNGQCVRQQTLYQLATTACVGHSNCQPTTMPTPYNTPAKP